MKILWIAKVVLVSLIISSTPVYSIQSSQNDGPQTTAPTDDGKQKLSGSSIAGIVTGAVAAVGAATYGIYRWMGRKKIEIQKKEQARREEEQRRKEQQAEQAKREEERKKQQHDDNQLEVEKYKQMREFHQQGDSFENNRIQVVAEENKKIFDEWKKEEAIKEQEEKQRLEEEQKKAEEIRKQRAEQQAEQAKREEEQTRQQEQVRREKEQRRKEQQAEKERREEEQKRRQQEEALQRRKEQLKAKQVAEQKKKEVDQQVAHFIDKDNDFLLRAVSSSTTPQQEKKHLEDLEQVISDYGNALGIKDWSKQFNKLKTKLEVLKKLKLDKMSEQVRDSEFIFTQILSILGLKIWISGGSIEYEKSHFIEKFIEENPSFKNEFNISGDHPDQRVVWMADYLFPCSFVISSYEDFLEKKLEFKEGEREFLCELDTLSINDRLKKLSALDGYVQLNGHSWDYNAILLGFQPATLNILDKESQAINYAKQFGYFQIKDFTQNYHNFRLLKSNSFSLCSHTTTYNILYSFIDEYWKSSLFGPIFYLKDKERLLATDFKKYQTDPKIKPFIEKIGGSYSITGILKTIDREREAEEKKDIPKTV